jgi:hypothetical protein
MTGKLSKTFLNKNSKYSFMPIFDEDLASVVETAFSEISDAKGKAY